jgi:hypothetical protein
MRAPRQRCTGYNRHGDQCGHYAARGKRWCALHEPVPLECVGGGPADGEMIQTWEFEHIVVMPDGTEYLYSQMPNPPFADVLQLSGVLPPLPAAHDEAERPEDAC